MAQRSSNRDRSAESTDVEGTEPETTVGATPEVEGTEPEGTEPQAAAGTEIETVTEPEGTGGDDSPEGEAGDGEPADELASLELPELSAMMREALNNADMELVQRLFPLIEAKGTEQAAAAPAGPKPRTGTTVKREVSQKIIDTLSANLDALIAGPADAPYTDAERAIAKDKVANICGYLPYAAKLTWPANFAPRTGRGMGRQVGADTADDASSE